MSYFNQNFCNAPIVDKIPENGAFTLWEMWFVADGLKDWISVVIYYAIPLMYFMCIYIIVSEARSAARKGEDYRPSSIAHWQVLIIFYLFFYVAGVLVTTGPVFGFLTLFLPDNAVCFVGQIYWRFFTLAGWFHGFIPKEQGVDFTFLNL